MSKNEHYVEFLKITSLVPGSKPTAASNPVLKASRAALLLPVWGIQELESEDLQVPAGSHSKPSQRSWAGPLRSLLSP